MRDWSDFDFASYYMTVSASQFEAWWECHRKWWFDKCKRLPELEGADHFTFGEIFHSVLERWLLADDQGRVPFPSTDKTVVWPEGHPLQHQLGGEPVDLYPPGWQTCEQGSVSTADAALIQVLVKAAIDSGMVARIPNREVEKKFQFKVVDTSHGPVSIMGFLDLASIHGNVLRYDDHKTTSNFRYAKKPGKKAAGSLGKNIQMLVGAAALLREFVRYGGSPDEVEQILLQHNYVLKNKQTPRTKPVTAAVSVDDVMKFWREIAIPTARDMADLRAAKVPLEEWAKVPGPHEKGACSKYGGCPYASVCTKRETPERYKERVKKMNQVKLTSTSEPPTPQGGIMDIFEDLEKMGETPAPTATAPAQTGTATEQQASDTAPAEAAPKTDAATNGGTVDQASAGGVSDRLPWAQDECIGCHGGPAPGITLKGKPCKMCIGNAEPADRPDALELSVDEGVVNVSRKGTLIASVTITGTPKSAAPAAPAEEAPAPATPQAAQEASDMANEQHAEAGAPTEETPATTTEEPKAEAKRRGRGRPKAGFTLVYGYARRALGVKTKDFGELFGEVSRGLAESKSKASYFELPPFDRRDWMAQVAPKVAEQLGKTFVMVDPAFMGNPEYREFLAALEATEFCTSVFGS